MKMRKQMELLVDEMIDGQILLGEALSEFEKLYIESSLSRNNNHISRTANALGIHRNTLSKRLDSYSHRKKKGTSAGKK